jgi:prepilin-type N-terminal cleavage/methylation domain-containing protein
MFKPVEERIFMKRNLKPSAKQRGFTLVEMSVTMAAAGLLFAAVTTGQELIDRAKATKLINEVKTIEMHLQRYAQVKGHLPGDCDADGVMDFDAGNETLVSSRADADNSVRALKYAYSVLQPTIPLNGYVADAQTDGCALLGAAVTGAVAGPPAVEAFGGSGTVYGVTTNATNANVWINDLKLGGVISDSVQNRRFAKLVHEDFVFVGKVTDANASVDPSSAVGADYNAIVLHNVPQWMAIRLAKAINGQDARSDRSRVRLLSRVAAGADGTYNTLWQTDAGDATTFLATRDNMVSVVYYFDRVPESKMGAV